ncbi:hypothetical protein N5923_24525 [Erwiniaceae bacterium BAC15a-03b]|uniref:Uncharacterized protein n=1 Tax=Winslowiella arboricola TaxID=2978220 RepID=A0A9J6PQS2_9GAMM|nr:hypothetical protein [Winslowiella arboricola]MCU5772907.1 hypothetical protein [Winslowiella arboricola]MCU5780665.1 hypothetical protein [Winslowiella arboricola]
MRNVMFKAARAVIYIVLAMLLIRFVCPLGNLVGRLQDKSYHLLSPEGLGLIDHAQEWGNDWASFITGVACILLIALIIALLIRVVIYTAKRNF